MLPVLINKFKQAMTKKVEIPTKRQSSVHDFLRFMAVQLNILTARLFNDQQVSPKAIYYVNIMIQLSNPMSHVMQA